MSDLWSRTELKKCGLRQSKEGVIISFVLHPDDVSRDLVNAKIGTRYLAALVEIKEDGAGDAETKEAKMQTQTAETEKPKINLTTQSAIVSGEPPFQMFLEEVKGLSIFPEGDMEEGKAGKLANTNAAEAIRSLCEVASRADFQRDEAAGERWKKLYSEYTAWRLTQ